MYKHCDTCDRIRWFAHVDMHHYKCMICKTMEVIDAKERENILREMRLSEDS